MIKGLTSAISMAAARTKAAWSVVTKGSIAPFNQLVDTGSYGVDRLNEPYSKSVWVQRAIKKVAGPIAAVSLQFTRGQEMVEEPELVNFWKAPAVGMSISDFIEASVLWLKLAGEFFWLLPDTVLGSQDTPFPEAGRGTPTVSMDGLTGGEQLIVARPDRMKHVVSGGKLVGWQFIDGARRRWNLVPEQVIHCKLVNPYDDYRGLGELEAACVAAEADWLAGKFNLNLMRNNGDQGPYIVAKSGIPTELQQKQIVEMLREKKELSLRGIFKPMFLTGDIAVEDPKVSVPDANFVDVRLGNRHEIFLAFGVPPSMADKMESYSIGSASDWYMLITETCIPTSEKLAQKMSVVSELLLGQSGTRSSSSLQGSSSLQAGFNWDEHPVMQAVRRERLDALVKLFAMGMPVKEANDHLQLGLPEYEGWDVGYLAFGLAPVGEVQIGATDPVKSAAFSEQDEEEEVTRRARRKANTENAEKKGLKERDQAHWRKQMAARQPIIRGFEAKFTKALMGARAEVLRKISNRKFEISNKSGSSGTTRPTSVTKAAAADFMFDLHSFAEGLKVAMRKQAGMALQAAGEQVFAELRRDDPWKTAPEEVLNFFRTRENRLTDVADEIFGEIKGGLQEGIDAGESIDELSKRVRSKFNDIDGERSRRIAMTETAAAFGTGRQEAMEAAGVPEKRWLTSGNTNVRPAHRAANGQVVEIDEAFEVGGEELMHPGDPSGSPENVINCHCVAVPVAGGKGIRGQVVKYSPDQPRDELGQFTEVEGSGSKELHHGTTQPNPVIHIGQTFTDDRSIAADYGRPSSAGAYTHLSGKVNFEGLRIAKVRSFDRDDANYGSIGDRPEDIRAYQERGIDLLQFEDESPRQRQHRSWRIVSERARERVEAAMKKERAYRE